LLKHVNVVEKQDQCLGVYVLSHCHDALLLSNSKKRSDADYGDCGRNDSDITSYRAVQNYFQHQD
jgi:hypothetical protein